MSARDLKSELKKAKIKKDEIKIVVHNFEAMVKSNKLDKNKVSIVVHNLVASEQFRAKFIKNPAGAIDEANPQPSP